MRITWFLTSAVALWGIGCATAPALAQTCEGYGPQSPRDIRAAEGANPQVFANTPALSDLNLCNIHFHIGAEHRGPGFTAAVAAADKGGFQCDRAASLTESELADPTDGEGVCGGVRPGDTIEAHWVYSSCQVEPGQGLAACSSEACANPQLRVEAQVFVVVNDENALDFASFDHAPATGETPHQAKALPTDTGEPVLYAGSTTGPDFSESECSPMQVSWSVRPMCAKVSLSSLRRWCESNVFSETEAHGVRELVTAKELLSTIE
jgi:hypothetical protein